jgi:NADH:ubiquinone oxidoreductase subunit D
MLLQAAGLLILASLATSDCGARTIVKVNELAQSIHSNPDQEKYPEKTSCEWLLQGIGRAATRVMGKFTLVFLLAKSNATIYLRFNSYDTECSYDFTFVYDGWSHASTLLAALSGDTLPDVIQSSSSQVGNGYKQWVCSAL